MDAQTQSNIYSFQLAQARRQAQLQAAQEQDQKRQEEADQKLFRRVLKVSIIADIIELLTLGTIWWFVGLAADYYLYKKTGQSKAMRAQRKKIIVAIIGETIPFVNALPLRTIFCLLSNPKVMEKLAKKLKVASKALNIAAKIPTPVTPELQAAAKVTKMASAGAEQATKARMLAQKPSEQPTLKQAT